ncbi:MAG TPA: WYL domain-containing protein [Gaiellales bacterium]|nr:WYL domain-containing protein [Gaiellales bacterium]
MRARRLISLLLLLQLGRRFTAADLAARLGVSTRTVHRDIDALLDAGVPVRADRGPGGGFALPAGHRSRVPLSAGEAQALLVGAPGAAGALGLGALLVDAQRKVLASLPGDLRQAASRAQQLIHVDEPRWFSDRDDPAFVAELASAAADRLRVQAEYRRDVAETLALEPLGLVLKAGVWYLAARPAAGEPRIYRVSRFSSVVVGAEGFRRPRGFDLAAFWEQSRDEFESSRPRMDVTLRVAEGDIGALRAAVDATVRPTVDRPGKPTGDGRTELTLTFERVEYAYADLVPLAGAVEVIAPLELRTRLAAAGRGLAARYAS